MAGNKAKTTARRMGDEGTEGAERKPQEGSGAPVDLPVEDPDPEAQPDGDPGPEDAKKAGR